MGLIFGHNARKIVTKGSLMASYQYVDEEECVVITRARHSGDNRPVVVIRLGELYKYADDGFLAKASVELCELLGFGVSGFAAQEIARFINERLEDLLTMKPIPENQRRVLDIDEVVMRERGMTVIGTVKH